MPSTARNFFLGTVGCLLLSLLSQAQSLTPTSATGPAGATARKLPPVYTTTPVNYQRVYTPQKPVTDSSAIGITAVPEDINIVTGYPDSYGRTLQTVVKQASPLKNDFVSPALYDEFGRATTSYLPFTSQSGNANDGNFKQNPFYQDSAFYKAQFSNEQINYGMAQFDGSPFNTPVKVMAPGNSWAGASIGITYTHRTNTITDSVRQWTIAVASEDDVPSTSGTYNAGTLTVQQITDERGIKSVSYQDELGRTILTKTQLAASPATGHFGWLCTYYVYDEMSHLRAVIPPKAVEALNNTTANWNLTANASINTNLCYAYWYDNLGNVLMKRLPGKGKIYTAYDALNRLVMTQDANLRTSSQWIFLQYDGQNRVIRGGKITMSGLTPAQVQVNAAASASYPTLTGTYVVTGETYYDDYSWFISGITPDGNLYTANITSANFSTNYNASPDYAQPITQSFRVRGTVTGSKKIVLGTSTYLYTSNIYDDNGRLIQSKQTNYTGSKDILTMQYGFSGRVLRTHLQHGKGGGTGNPVQNHTLLSKYTYDHVGRLTSIVKNIDATGDKVTLQNSYNEIGQLSNKTLGSSLESQTFNYNIRGWLSGINKSFVETVNSANYFGEELFYDFGFTATQLNGNIAGVKWRSTGDDIQRAYGYSYDNTNRILKADFTQQNAGSSSWTQDKMDFSVSSLSYDANGNILGMKQRGVDVNKPVTIDSLTYTYLSNSNQLQKISDGITATNPWGDFKDTSATSDDYAYDANGNIVMDLNKHIHANGIGYNVLDKPNTISVNGKGTIGYVYDATGTLLQKTATDTRTGIMKVTTYVAGFVYQKTLPQNGNAATTPDTLQYTLHEEGRIRWVVNKNLFAYDYFLKDHLGNIRSTITDQKDTATYVATMESVDSITVRALFANVYDPVSTVSPKPPGFDANNSNQKVSKLNGSTSVNKPNGPAILLKVMAGDQVSVSSYGFYNTAVQPSQGIDYLTPLISALTGSVVGTSMGKMGAVQASTINSTLSAATNVPSFLGSRNYTSTQPKAYLNWILLDEQLNYVSSNSNSGAQQLTQSGTKQGLSSGMQTISKSGYLYVWVSNESAMDVYFDDISVVHYKGALLSEEGYYPFGLAMNALSSHAGAVTPNAYKYNAGTELTEDLDVDYYETYMRQYDAQIGRFTGVDMLGEATFNISPYTFSANNPIYFNDPSGALLTRRGASPSMDIVRVGSGYSLPAIDGGLLSGYGGIDIDYSSGSDEGETDGGGSSGGMDFGWAFSSYSGAGMGGSYGDFGGGHGGGGGGGSSQAYHYHYLNENPNPNKRNNTDLEKKPHPGQENPNVTSDYKNTQDAYDKFSRAFGFGALTSLNSEFIYEANELKDNFDHGNGHHMDMTCSQIAKHVANCAEFKEFKNEFENAAKQSYKDHDNSLNDFKGNDELRKDHPKYLSYPWNDLSLTTVLGGYKILDADVTVNNGNLSFTYTIYDVFGAGTDDSYSNLPGLEALYYCQDYGNLPGFTFIPFIWFLTIPCPNP